MVDSALPAGFTTRFAPAPTGLLHLGHVASALFVWGLARRFGGRVLLRIEDHDRSRSRATFERALREDLEWLELEPDGPVVRQRERTALYEEALARLERGGLVYACDCTRAAIRDVAPVEPGEEPRYPGTCRERGLRPEGSPMRRVRLEPRDVAFHDLRQGRQVHRPADQCGDLLARDRNANWTYQFAVTVDDYAQGVDIVIRGEDLLESTGRQIQLAAMLGRVVPPRFLHHPLVTGPEGRKLSKSLNDMGIRELRSSGFSAEQVRGRAAHAVGLIGAEREVGSDEIRDLVAGVLPRSG